MSRRAYGLLAAAIVALAAVAIVNLLRTQSDANACRDAAADVLLVRQGEVERTRLGPAVVRLREGCTDSDAPAQAAVNLLGIDKRGPALALARDVVRREPENYRGWLILAATLPPGERDQIRRARARAHTLNPLLPR